MKIPIRRLGLLPALLAVALVAGCHPSNPMAGEVQTAPGGGDDAQVHSMRLDDVYAWAPHGIPAGGTAPLHVALSNGSKEPDELVGVTAGGVRSVELLRKGRRVTELAVPPRRVTNLEWHTDLLLDGAREPLGTGDVVPVTFHFAHAGSVTVSAMLEPAYPGWYR